MAVTAWATQPPVQDSAVASIRPRAFSFAPTQLASAVMVSEAIAHHPNTALHTAMASSV